jgi:hypothetical protein
MRSIRRLAWRAAPSSGGCRPRSTLKTKRLWLDNAGKPMTERDQVNKRTRRAFGRTCSATALEQVENSYVGIPRIRVL